jgi:hypothetical protein
MFIFFGPDDRVLVDIFTRLLLGKADMDKI